MEILTNVVKLYSVEADQVDSIQGKFDIVVLGKNSKLFNQVFLPLEPIEVEKPFFKAMDSVAVILYRHQV